MPPRVRGRLASPCLAPQAAGLINTDPRTATSSCALSAAIGISPSRRICCCPSRQGRPGAAIADVRRHRAASAVKTILVSPLSPPPSTHACFSRSHTRSLGPSPCFAGELRLAGNGRHLHQDPNPLNESRERRS